MTKRSEGSTRSVVHDRWDSADLRSARQEISAFQRARKKINDATETGTPALDDTFFVLLKADPHQVPVSAMSDSYRVNHWVIGEMMGLSAVQRLREHTVGDLVQSAVGCVDLEHTLATVFDKLRTAQRVANHLEHLRVKLIDLEATLDELHDEVDEADDSGDVSEEERQAAAALRTGEEYRDLLQASIESMEERLQEELEEQGPAVRMALQGGVSDAGDKAFETVSTARAWGTSPGVLRRLPADERLELAKTLNDDKMRKVADLFGRIENLALSSVAEEVDDLFEEVSDLELGADLARVVPAELLLLGNPDTEQDFLARWSDGELMQYKVHGEDTQGRGGIVYCLDGSMSMAGAREVFGKALMLFLLHQARRQRRLMHVIHFGYRQTMTYSFARPEDFTAERIIEAAQMFWGSGTDFEVPLEEALRLLEGEHAATGRVRSDVVLVSDDEYYMRPAFLADYLGRMEVIGGRTWGVLVDPTDVDPQGALAQVSQGRTASAKDLRSGRDLRPLLAGVR